MDLRRAELEIVRRWSDVQNSIKFDLANIWKEKEQEEIKEIASSVEEIEAKVVRILRLLNTSKSKIKEYEKNTTKLISLLKHVKSNTDWAVKTSHTLHMIIQELEADMPLWDGHVHTYFSDGDYSPVQVIEIAKKRNMHTVAVCDHDNTAGIKEAVIAGRHLGIVVIPGIEISCKSSKDANTEVHMLGMWHPDWSDTESLIEIGKVLEKVRKVRTKRTFMQLEKYSKLGHKLDIGQPSDYDKGYASRSHLAKARFIEEHGVSPEAAIKEGKKDLVKKEMKRFLKETGAGGDAYVSYSEAENAYGSKAFMEPTDAVRLIQKQHGIPIFAHPGEYLDKFVKNALKNEQISQKMARAKAEYSLKRLVRELIGCGLRGMEVYTPKHDTSTTELLIEIANQNNLIKTLGSDYHGMELKPQISLGSGVDDNLMQYNRMQDLQKLRSALNEQRQRFKVRKAA